MKYLFLSLLIFLFFVIISNIFIAKRESKFINEPIVVNDPITDLVSSLSREQKIGQMFMFGFKDTGREQWMDEFLGRKFIGGVLLLESSIVDEGQLRGLTEEIQRNRGAKDMPVIVAVDQEGGLVNRVDFVSEKRGARVLKNEEEARGVGFGRAIELKGLGINTNLAPLADFVESPLSFLYERTFPGPEDNISKLVRSTILGQRQGGIISTVKHFPGHGVSITDSHKTMPISHIGIEELEEKHLAPFGAAVNEGVEIVMLAHILLPNIDRMSVPFSPYFVEDLLRNKLRFEGVVLTDDFNMGAISNSYMTEDAVIKAVKAGVDMIIIAGPEEKQRKAYDALLNSLNQGEISEERINESLYRILEIKKRI